MTPLPGPPAERWDRLAAATRNVFATRSFAECWWAAHGGPGEPVFVDLDEGFVPLYRRSGRPRVLRLVGHGDADELGPVCEPAVLPAVVAGLRDHLGGTGGAWDAVLLHDVPAGALAALPAHVLRRTSSPVVRLRAVDWDAFLGARSRNFRQQLRRRERRLHDAFEVVVRETTDTGDLPRDLETFFLLHRARWGDRASFAEGATAQLVRSFSEQALGADRLRLLTMELDGRPAATLLGLRFAGVESYWQAGRDPRFDDHSVGFLLLAEALRRAVEAGADEYRLLRGDEVYKSRFADADRPVETVALGRGVVGRAVVGALRARGRRAGYAGPAAGGSLASGGT